MCTMLGDPIGAIDTEYPPFGQTVERKDVVMGHTPQLHVITVHQIEQINACLHPLPLTVQFVTHRIHVVRKIMTFIMLR